MSRHIQLSIDPSIKSRSRKTGEIVRRVARYLIPYKWMAVATISCAILSLAAGFAYPYLTQFVIDEVIGQKQKQWLGFAALGLFAAFFLRDAFNSIRIR